MRSKHEATCYRPELGISPEEFACQMRRQGWVPASKSYKFDPVQYDFRWNEDFTWFQPIRLAWWDEESYIQYQCENTEED